jgi:hypothetical protein
VAVPVPSSIGIYAGVDIAGRERSTEISLFS